MIINYNVDDFVYNLNKGKIACFKTDTIWGFSAASDNKEAIENLYKIKKRNLDKPFIFLIKKNQNLLDLVKTIPPKAQKLINKFWCGPLTIIFEAKENLPLLAPYKNKKTIALRMPEDELTQQILGKLSYPLPSTSVNTEGQPALNSFEEISKTFGKEDFCILSKVGFSETNSKENFSANLKYKESLNHNLNKIKHSNNESFEKLEQEINNKTIKNTSSTIVSFANGDIEFLREGSITKQQILDALK